MLNKNKHKNYEILNLLGYGLAKFDNLFIKEFGFKTKTDFYDAMVNYNIAETGSVVKNRQDLFDPFFNNGRRGWWQKGDAYIHRKHFIDSLFGKLDVASYAQVVKLYLNERFDYKQDNNDIEVQPIMKSQFKQLQKTGLEAEMYFLHNYKNILLFHNATIEDARLLGDGYDFQMNTESDYFLAEVKGIREKKGKLRLTANEYQKAIEYKDNYILSIVLNLDEIPKFLIVEDPIRQLEFEEKIISSKIQKEYHLKEKIS